MRATKCLARSRADRESRRPVREGRVDAARRQWRGRSKRVLDVIFVLATLGYFAINVAFAAGCDRLMGRGRGGR